MWRLPIRFFSKVEIFISNLPAAFKPEDIANIMPAESEYKLSKTYCFVSVPEQSNLSNLITTLNQTTVGNNLLKARLNNYKVKIQSPPLKLNNPSNKKPNSPPKAFEYKGLRPHQKLEENVDKATKSNTEEHEVKEESPEVANKTDKKPIILGDKRKGFKVQKNLEFYEKRSEVREMEMEREKEKERKREAVEAMDIEDDFVETYHFRADFRLK
ncbi:hypothetical protein SteCoe_20646 [Stentor coeruleus]|uniref:RRM domain-containing protein n=1 Tax=Stentor coeruleus TaxID=5963 RepID=A0A1R2BRC4_9CILI|nr:hypothetical protein SteCoe_20646 [Stentor coeruleus]